MLKRLSFLLMLIFLLTFIVACSDSSGGSSESDASSNDTTESSESSEESEGGEGGTIKIGVLASLTGALESYGKQTSQGFELGLEYATDGTMEVAGKKIEVVYEDTETKPEVAVQKATKL